MRCSKNISDNGIVMNFEGEKNFSERAREKIALFMAVGVFLTGLGVMGLRFEKENGLTADQYIEHIEKQRGRPMNEKKAGALKERLQRLGDEYSPFILRHIQEGDSIAFKTNQEMPDMPIIDGFEAIGIKSGDLKSLWNEDNYPKGTINGNVAQVRFEIKDKKGSLGHYGMEEASRAEGTDDFKDELIFFGYPGEIATGDARATRESLDWHFAHGLGHLNDWVSANNLSPEERIRFLDEVTTAFKKKGSFRDVMGYIDGIKNQNEQYERYFKVREYWASLAEYYFTFPDLFEEKATPEEQTLVERWIKHSDPSFNNEVSWAERHEVLERLLGSP